MRKLTLWKIILTFATLMMVLACKQDVVSSSSEELSSSSEEISSSSEILSSSSEEFSSSSDILSSSSSSSNGSIILDSLNLDSLKLDSSYILDEDSLMDTISTIGIYGLLDSNKSSDDDITIVASAENLVWGGMYPRTAYIGTFFASSFGKAMIKTDSLVYGNGLFLTMRSESYYTKFVEATSGEIFDIVLLELPNIENGITGIQYNYSSGVPVYNSYPFDLLSPSGDTVCVTPNKDGIYYIDTDEIGPWLVINGYEDSYGYDTLYNENGLSYADIYRRSDPMMVYAPNIYLYPESDTKIDVTLIENDKAKLKESLPLYNDGWSVMVDTEGWINSGEYGYLFYDFYIKPDPSVGQGWCVLGDETLGQSFENLLTLYGFTGREITDFNEYWLPKLETEPYYIIEIYDAEDYMGVEISPKPESFTRLLWKITPSDTKVDLVEPTIEKNLRQGYFVMEWGVMI